MIQATNELILGIELNEAYGQLTYYHQSVREPVTLADPRDPSRLHLPMGLGQDAQGRWQLEDRPMGAEILADTQLLQHYFALCLTHLEVLMHNAQLHVMVTVRELTRELGERIIKALEGCGILRRQIYVQDYLSAFYYYAVNQKRELWYQDVAMLEYHEESIVGYILHIDRSTKPAIARAEMVARQPMGEAIRAGREEQEWDKERDRLFFELLKKVLERRTVSASYLVGDYFDKNWARRSIQYLCYRRHAFQGSNLYSRGACYAAMERAGLISGREIIFSGKDMIDRNIQMELRIRGKEVQVPLITAGVNWYEAYHTCELIPDHEREIRLLSSPMTQGEEIVHRLRLTGLPERPNRATRLRLSLYFTEPDRCQVEVEDLGFGGLYRSSGLTWSRTLVF